jgi:ergothioneine biosynthesis protein EgtB
VTETESIVIHDPAPLEERFPVVRAQAEHLASPLSPEDQTVQSMPDASPTKWHRAHTSWFFELFLLQSSERAPARNPYQCYDESFAYLFNSYYETVGARHPRPERGLVSRPGVAEVSAYRVHVDEAMSVLLAEEQDKAMTELVELGLHHEQQHQELLLMDIKHALFCNPVHPRYLEQEVRALASASNGTIQTQAWNEHEGGLIEIGHQGGGFAFDNELPRHAVFLGPFAVGTALVTCGQWVEFMADGGYQRPELWLSDGWSTVQEQRWRSPLYWSRVDDEWWEFTLHGGRPVRFAQPVVHVSY